MDGESCLRQAYEAIFQGDFEQAVAWFGQAIAAEPDNASFYHKGSITCARSGKLVLALAYAAKAVELEPDEPVYRLNWNVISAKRSVLEARQLLAEQPPDLDRIAGLLRSAAACDPLSAEARLLLGFVCRLQGDYGSALNALRDAHLLDPGNAEIKRHLQEARAERRRLLKQQYSSNNVKRNR